MNDVVRLDNVSKRYGKQTALNNVSFSVPKGSVFAMLGENGAGKTTAIRILLGLADADAGRTEVLGLPSAICGTDIRRRVGYVPEEPDLYDWMTVNEIGWFAAAFHPEGYWQRYRELIEGFHVPHDRKIRAPLARHAGEGASIVGAGTRSGAVDSRRADLRARRDRAARVPRKHG